MSNKSHNEELEQLNFGLDSTGRKIRDLKTLKSITDRVADVTKISLTMGGAIIVATTPFGWAGLVTITVLRAASDIPSNMVESEIQRLEAKEEGDYRLLLDTYDNTPDQTERFNAKMELRDRFPTRLIEDGRHDVLDTSGHDLFDSMIDKDPSYKEPDLERVRDVGMDREREIEIRDRDQKR